MHATTLYEEAKRRLDELKDAQAKLSKKLSSAPEGKIHIVKSRKRIQFYLRKEPQDKSGKYIRQSEHRKIHTYLNKDYSEKVLKYISQEIKNLDRFIENTSDSIQKIQQLYSDNPQKIKDYLMPVDISNEDYIKQWMSIPYEGKAIDPNISTYETDLGEKVRSKSELMIANELHKMGIPYKYECPLKLKNGSIIFPDFTILDIVTRKVKYWEHRGMMDDPVYLRHTVKRIRTYADNGYFLGDDLIITEENSVLGLGTKEIQQTIAHYFCVEDQKKKNGRQ